MSDLIDRQAALDAIKKLEKPAPTAQHLSAIFDCEDTIKALPSARPDVSDTNVGKICEYYDLCRNGRDEKKLREELLSAQPGCEDTVPRTSVEYICRKNTVSTNPYEHKYHDKFIQFMDDPEISDFGRWQHSNGFNTALVAVKCDLDKVSSVTPKQPGWIPCKTALPEHDGEYLVTKKSFGWNCTEYIETDIARYEKKNGWNKADTVLAWRELPKPWEGGQDGET